MTVSPRARWLWQSLPAGDADVRVLTALSTVVLRAGAEADRAQLLGTVEDFRGAAGGVSGGLD